METGWPVAIQFVLSYEGGYANDPSDTGGETFRGVSRRSWPLWEGWEIVDRVKSAFPEDFRSVLLRDDDLRLRATDFYRQNFWAAIHGDELPDKFAVALFDAAVHSGVKRAVRLLQSALDEYADGVVGPKTVKACFDRGENGLIEFLAARAELLHNIMVNHEKQRMWALNWFKRLFKLANVVLEEAEA